MEKLKIKKEFKKACPVSIEKRILLSRRGIRYYPCPHKEKLIPICS